MILWTWTSNSALRDHSRGPRWLTRASREAKGGAGVEKKVLS
jgi:hypothetical protein